MPKRRNFRCYSNADLEKKNFEKYSDNFRKENEESLDVSVMDDTSK